MWNFKIEVELLGAESEEYGALDVAMEARGFKTRDGTGRALPDRGVQVRVLLVSESPLSSARRDNPFLGGAVPL